MKFLTSIIAPLALLSGFWVLFACKESAPEAAAPAPAEPVVEVPSDPVEAEIFTLVPQFKEKLEAFKNKESEPGERTLKVVYWTPSDRDPAPGYHERLDKILKRISEYYGEEMERIGYGKNGLKFDYQEDGKIDITVVTGKKPYKNYQTNSGNEIRNECLPELKKKGIDANEETIVIFCNMSNWDPKKSTITQNSPYYAGGTNFNGTAWQVDSPILNLDDLANKTDRVRDGQYGFITLGQYNSIFIGGIAHELGHALGLPHNRERGDEGGLLGTALMGSGNRTFGEELRGESKGSFLTLAHATRLASHPMFSGSVKKMKVPIDLKLTDLKLEPGDDEVTISGNAKSTLELYAVVAYCDPAGGGDYNAFTHVAPIAKDGSFSIKCSEFDKKGPGEIRLVFMQVNGAASNFVGPNSAYSYPYQIGADGKLDMSPSVARLLMEPLGQAVAKGDKAGAQEAFDALKSNSEAKFLVPSATALLESMNRRRPSQSPAQIASTDQKELFLSAAKATSIKVGYGRPAFDQVPGKNAALLINNRIFSHSVYAHGPSEITYELGGKWNSFAGTSGIAPGAWGKAVFQIEGDGKVLWKSKLLDKDKSQDFKVDVSGVKTLILRTLEGDGSNGSDWTIWLDPTLKR